MTTPVLPDPLTVESAEGEDRSAFQPVKSWGTNSFAFMKATEGLSFIDPDFAQNWANAKAAGIPRGAYCFVHPSDSATGQAALFLETVAAQGLEDGDMLALDVEITSGADGRPMYANQWAAGRSVLKLSRDPLAAGAAASVTLTMMADLEKAFPHCPGVVYTDESVGHTLDGCQKYPLWMAYPGAVAPTNIAPWTRWTFWQWGFGNGQGGGDSDAFNGTVADMKAWIKTYLPDPPSTGNQPAHVFGSAKYNNATITWAGLQGKTVDGFEVYLAKPDHTTIDKASLPATARSFTFHRIRQDTEYALGVLAKPAAAGVEAKYVTVKTK
jgi:GH25 family lysozyme M1 (1,4-beta-N-acetylmuramidase)